MLRGKNILVCVTGGIAAYKMPNLVSMLAKQGCNVNVLMTKNAKSPTMAIAMFVMLFLSVSFR